MTYRNPRPDFEFSIRLTPKLWRVTTTMVIEGGQGRSTYGPRGAELMRTLGTYMYMPAQRGSWSPIHVVLDLSSLMCFAHGLP